MMIIMMMIIMKMIMMMIMMMNLFQRRSRKYCPEVWAGNRIISVRRIEDKENLFVIESHKSGWMQVNSSHSSAILPSLPLLNISLRGECQLCSSWRHFYFKQNHLQSIYIKSVWTAEYFTMCQYDMRIYLWKWNYIMFHHPPTISATSLSSLSL